MTDRGRSAKPNKVKTALLRIRKKAAKRAELSLRGTFTPVVCAVAFLACAVLLISVCRSYSASVDEPESLNRAENGYYLHLIEEESRLAAESIAAAQAPKEVGDGVFAQNVLMVRCSDGRVICRKGADLRIYPASMTKLITALVAIENLPDPDHTEFVVTQEIIDYCRSQSASRAGYLAGEHSTATDLLYCTVLPSGADAALALAQGIAGSESAFVALMNQKVRELGLENTNLTNVTGLHDDRHYTTLSDLSAIIRYGLQNDTFRELITSSRHTIVSTDLHPKGFTVRSTIFSAMANYETECPYILGGKTGFTLQAGQCLAAYTFCKNDYYLVIVANCAATNYSANHVMDVNALLEQYVVSAG